MYPLGHNVSDTSSTGITSGDSDSEDDADENDAALLLVIFDTVRVVLDVVTAVLEPIIALSD